MPSLMRFLSALGLLAAIGFAGLYSLATFVTPRTREMSVTIPATRLAKPAHVDAENASPRTATAQSSTEQGSATR